MSTNQPPDCYGKLWENSAAECAGGYDAGYTGTNGGHVRTKCDFFDSCKVRTQLVKASSGGSSLIPPSALNRQQPGAQQPPYGWMPPWSSAPPPLARQPGGSPAAQPGAAQQFQTPMPWMMNQQAQHPMLAMMQMMQMMQGMNGWNPNVPPPVYPGNFPVQGNIDPIKMMAMNYGMPSYLSVPEPTGGAFWSTMGREIFRGMGKALGHSIAHFFDHHSFR